MCPGLHDGRNDFTASSYHPAPARRPLAEAPAAPLTSRDRSLQAGCTNQPLTSNPACPRKVPRFLSQLQRSLLGLCQSLESGAAEDDVSSKAGTEVERENGDRGYCHHGIAKAAMALLEAQVLQLEHPPCNRLLLFFSLLRYNALPRRPSSKNPTRKGYGILLPRSLCLCAPTYVRRTAGWSKAEGCAR